MAVFTLRAIQEYNLGLYKYNEGKYNEALTYFEISSKVLPFYITHTCYIAKIHLLKNQYTEAHRFIETELTKYPFNDRLSEIFCLILMKENNLEEAGFYAKTSLKKDIANTFPLPVLAEISRKKGNFKAAISLWHLYQQSFPFDPQANLALIELYAQTKDYRMLDHELRLLNALKGNKDIVSYIKEVAQEENLLIYVPNTRKIVLIARERYK